MRLSYRGWLAIHLGTLVIAFVILFVINIHAWFIGDEWDMIVRATQPLTIHALFSPHNEHWSTVPILIYRILVDLFGLRTYAPYLCVLFAAHLGLAHLLWRLMRQVGASDACAAALAAIFAVLGAGAQVTNAFQLSFVISVAVGIGAVLLANVESLRSAQRQIGVVALMLLGLMSSNVGVTMTVFCWAGGVLSARPSNDFTACCCTGGRLHCLVRCLRLFVTLNRSDNPCHSVGVASLRVDGIHLIHGRFYWSGRIWRRHRGWDPRVRDLEIGRSIYSRGASLCGSSLVIVLFLSAGLVRTFLGTSQSTATRYAYIAIALLLPLFALGIMNLRNRAGRHFGLILGTVVLLLIAGSNHAQLRTFALLLRPLERTD
jgi:hypothetical protein